MIPTIRCTLGIGLVAVSAALLTGCGQQVSGTADPTATNERSAGSGQPIEITAWGEGTTLGAPW